MRVTLHGVPNLLGSRPPVRGWPLFCSACDVPGLALAAYWCDDSRFRREDLTMPKAKPTTKAKPTKRKPTRKLINHKDD